MLIEHSVAIHADINTLWNIFMDMTCWKDWSTVLGKVSSDEERLKEGKVFTFCIRPFAIPIHIEPQVEEVVPGKRIVWSGKKYGIRARHEFIFREEKDCVVLTSREIFQSGPVKSLLFHLPGKKLRQLSEMLLKELKEAAEKAEMTQAL
jgi:hypothetical protein